MWHQHREGAADNAQGPECALQAHKHTTAHFTLHTCDDGHPALELVGTLIALSNEDGLGVLPGRPQQSAKQAVEIDACVRSAAAHCLSQALAHHVCLCARLLVLRGAEHREDVEGADDRGVWTATVGAEWRGAMLAAPSFSPAHTCLSASIGLIASAAFCGDAVAMVSREREVRLGFAADESNDIGGCRHNENTLLVD